MCYKCTQCIIHGSVLIFLSHISNISAQFYLAASTLSCLSNRGWQLMGNGSNCTMFIYLIYPTEYTRTSKQDQTGQIHLEKGYGKVCQWPLHSSSVLLPSPVLLLDYQSFVYCQSMPEVAKFWTVSMQSTCQAEPTLLFSSCRCFSTLAEIACACRSNEFTSANSRSAPKTNNVQLPTQ